MKTIKCKTQVPRIAYISDLHGYSGVEGIISKLKKEEDIELIVLGGDYTDYTIPGTKKIVKEFLELKKPVVIIPGSHENYEVQEAIISKLKSKNLIDGYKQNQIKIGFYELIIIGGSSSVVVGTKKFRGGSYWQIEGGKNKKKVQKEADKKLLELKSSRKATLVFIDDISKIAKKSKTPAKQKIVLTHNPPMCKTSKGLDLAVFGKITKTFSIKNEHLKNKDFKGINPNDSFEKGAVLTIEEYKILKKYNYPVKQQKEHVGSKSITTLLNKNRITKLICGHIHEAGQRAIDKQENPVKQKEWTHDVRINSGEGRKGLFTIMDLGPNGNVKYKFVKK